MLPVWSDLTPEAWVQSPWAHYARQFDPRNRLLTSVTRVVAFLTAFAGPLWMAWLTSDDHVFTWSCWTSGALAGISAMLFLTHDRLCMEAGWKRLSSHLAQAQGVPVEHLAISPEIPWNLRRHLVKAGHGVACFWSRPVASLGVTGEDLLRAGWRRSVWWHALATSGWSPTLMVHIYHALSEGVAKDRLEYFLGSTYPGWSLLPDPHALDRKS